MTIQAKPTDATAAPPFPVLAVAAAASSVFAHAYSMTSVFPYLGPLVVHYGLAEHVDAAGFYAGFVGGSFMVGRALTALLWGMAADRVGRKPVLVGCLLFLAAFQLLFGLAPSFAVAVLARFLLGVSNGIVGAAKTVAAELVPADSRLAQGRSMGIVSAGISLGCLLGPAMGGALVGDVVEAATLGGGGGGGAGMGGYTNASAINTSIGSGSSSGSGSGRGSSRIGSGVGGVANGTSTAGGHLSGTVADSFPFILPNLVGSGVALFSAVFVALCMPETRWGSEPRPGKKKMKMKLKIKGSSKYAKVVDGVRREKGRGGEETKGLEDADAVGSVTVQSGQSGSPRTEEDTFSVAVIDAQAEIETDTDTDTDTNADKFDGNTDAADTDDAHVDSSAIIVGTISAGAGTTTSVEAGTRDDANTSNIVRGVAEPAAAGTSSSKPPPPSPPRVRMIDVCRDGKVIRAVLIYSGHGMVDMFMNEVFPLWCVVSLRAGGPALTTRMIGTISSVSGALMVLYQMTLFPCVSKRWSPRRLIPLAMQLLFPICLALPFATALIGGGNSSSLNDTAAEKNDASYVRSSVSSMYGAGDGNVGVILLIALGWTIRSTIGLTAFTSIFIVINESTTVDRRGAVNGIAMMAASIAKGVGPLIGAPILAWSVTNGIRVPPLDQHFVFWLAAVLWLLLSFVARCILPPVGTVAGAAPEGGGGEGGGGEAVRGEAGEGGGGGGGGGGKI